jgi:hypothetical protein
VTIADLCAAYHSRFPHQEARAQTPHLASPPPSDRSETLRYLVRRPPARTVRDRRVLPPKPTVSMGSVPRLSHCQTGWVQSCILSSCRVSRAGLRIAAIRRCHSRSRACAYLGDPRRAACGIWGHPTSQRHRCRPDAEHGKVILRGSDGTMHEFQVTKDVLQTYKVRDRSR